MCWVHIAHKYLKTKNVSIVITIYDDTRNMRDKKLDLLLLFIWFRRYFWKFMRNTQFKRTHEKEKRRRKTKIGGSEKMIFFGNGDSIIDKAQQNTRINEITLNKCRTGTNKWNLTRKLEKKQECRNGKNCRNCRYINIYIFEPTKI